MHLAPKSPAGPAVVLGMRTSAPHPPARPARADYAQALRLEPAALADAPEAVAAGVTLVQRAQAGDAEAFGELYDRYVDVVFRYLSARVASRQLAEDLTSETFLRALRRITTFSWQGRDVGAWLTTIARNLLTDHYKSGRHRLELSTGDVTESGPTPLHNGPEHEVLDAMSHRVVLEAVGRLSPEQQECIRLRFLQGLTVTETAQAMGRGEAAVRALQHRAVRSLGRLVPEAAVR